MRNLLFSVFIALLSVLTSCNNSSNSEEIRKIDSLNMELDSIGIVLKTVDSADVYEAWENFNNFRNAFIKVFPDERDEYWTTITRYFDIKKGLKEYVKQYPGINKEYKFSKEQLEALEDEVRNNNLTKEEFDKYFNDEAEAIRSLKQLAFFIVKYAERDVSIYDSLSPEMNKILEVYKAKATE